MTWLRLAFSLCSLASSCDLDRGHIQKLRKQHEMNGCGFIVVDFCSKYQFHGFDLPLTMPEYSDLHWSDAGPLKDLVVSSQYVLGVPIL